MAENTEALVAEALHSLAKETQSEDIDEMVFLIWFPVQVSATATTAINVKHPLRSLLSALANHPTQLIEYTSQATRKIKPNTWNKMSRIQEAVDVLFEMNNNGVSADHVSYSTIIYEYCRIGDLQEAIKLWDSMIDNGLKPDIVAYNIIIHCCCVAGELTKAIDFRDDMVKRGMKPNAATAI